MHPGGPRLRLLTRESGRHVGCRRDPAHHAGGELSPLFPGNRCSLRPAHKKSGRVRFREILRSGLRGARRLDSGWKEVIDFRFRVCTLQDRRFGPSPTRSSNSA